MLVECEKGIFGTNTYLFSEYRFLQRTLVRYGMMNIVHFNKDSTPFKAMESLNVQTTGFDIKESSSGLKHDEYDISEDNHNITIFYTPCYFCVRCFCLGRVSFNQRRHFLYSYYID